MVYYRYDRYCNDFCFNRLCLLPGSPVDPVNQDQGSELGLADFVDKLTWFVGYEWVFHYDTPTNDFSDNWVDCCVLELLVGSEDKVQKSVDRLPGLPYIIGIRKGERL